MKACICCFTQMKYRYNNCISFLSQLPENSSLKTHLQFFMKKVVSYITYEDVGDIYQHYKLSLAKVYEANSQEALTQLLFSAEAIFHLLPLPGFFEEINKRAQIDLFVQMEILQAKAALWKELGNQISKIAYLILKYLSQSIPNPKHKAKIPLKDVKPPLLKDFIQRTFISKNQAHIMRITRILRICLKYGQQSGQFFQFFQQGVIIPDLIDKAILLDSIANQAYEFLQISPKNRAQSVRNGVLSLTCKLLSLNTISKSQSLRMLNFLISLVEDQQVAQLFNKQNYHSPLNNFMNLFIENDQSLRLVSKLLQKISRVRSNEDIQIQNQDFQQTQQSLKKYLQDSTLFQCEGVIKLIYKLRLYAMLKVHSQQLVDNQFYGYLISLLERQTAFTDDIEFHCMISFKIFAVLYQIFSLPGSQIIDLMKNICPQIMRLFKKIISSPKILLLTNLAKIVCRLISISQISSIVLKICKKQDFVDMIDNSIKEVSQYSATKNNLLKIRKFCTDNQLQLSVKPQQTAARSVKQQGVLQSPLLRQPQRDETNKGDLERVQFYRQVNQNILNIQFCQLQLRKGLASKIISFLKEINTSLGKFQPQVYYIKKGYQHPLVFVQERNNLQTTDIEIMFQILSILAKLYRSEVLTVFSSQLVAQLLGFSRLTNGRKLAHQTLKVLQLLSVQEKIVQILKSLQAIQTMKVLLCKHVIYRPIINEIGQIMFSLRGQVTESDKNKFLTMIKSSKGSQLIEGLMDFAAFLCVSPQNQQIVVQSNLKIVDQLNRLPWQGQLRIPMLLVVLRLCFQGFKTRLMISKHSIVDRFLQLTKDQKLSNLCLEILSFLFQMDCKLNSVGSRRSSINSRLAKICLNLLEYLPINEYFLRFADKVIGNVSVSDQQLIEAKLAISSQQILKINRNEWIPGSILNLLCGNPELEEEIWSGNAHRMLNTLDYPNLQALQLLRFLNLYTEKSRNFQRIKKMRLLPSLLRLLNRLAQIPKEEFYISPINFQLLKELIQVLSHLLNDQSMVDEMDKQDIATTMNTILKKFSQEYQVFEESVDIIGRSQPQLRVCQEIYRYLSQLVSRHGKSAEQLAKSIKPEDELVQLPVQVSDSFMMHHLFRIVRNLHQYQTEDKGVANRLGQIDSILKNAKSTTYNKVIFQEPDKQQIIECEKVMLNPTLQNLLPLVRQYSRGKVLTIGLNQILKKLENLLQGIKGQIFDIPSYYGKVLSDLLVKENTKLQAGQNFTLICSCLAKCEVYVQLNNDLMAVFQHPHKSKLRGLLILAKGFFFRNRVFFQNFVWGCKQQSQLSKEIVNCLQMFTSNQKSSQQYFDKGLAKFLIQQLRKSSSHPDSVLKSILRVCTSCSKYPIYKNYFLIEKVNQLLLPLLQLYIKNPEISSAIVYLLAILVHRNPDGVTRVATDKMLSTIIKCLNLNLAQYLVTQACSSFFSNVTFKNDNIKIRIGNLGAVQALMKALDQNCRNLKKYKNSTFKQILRALGNSSLILWNAKEIVRLRYQSYLITLLAHLGKKQDLQIIKYLLDVLSNLVSHPEREFRNQIQIIYKQGCVQALFKLIQSHVLNTDIIAACLDAIDGLSQNQAISRSVMEKNIIPLIVSCVRGQGWSQDIVLKGMRLISNLSLNRMNVPKIVSFNVPTLISSVLPKQMPIDKLQKKFNKSFKILDKINAQKMGKQQLIRSGYSDALVDSIKYIARPEYVNQLQIMLLQNIREGNLNQSALKRVAVPVLNRLMQNQHRIQGIVSNGLAILTEIQPKINRTQPNQYHSYLQFAQLFLVQKKMIGDQRYQDRVLELFQLYNQIINADEGVRKYLSNSNFQNLVNEWKRISTALGLSDIKKLTEGLIKLLQQKNARQSLAFIPVEERQLLPIKQCLQFFKKGVQFRMFRSDGSFKRGQLMLTPDQLGLMAHKYPGGQFKSKYMLPIRQISQQRFSYALGTKIWELSVFNKVSFFATSPVPQRCFTIRLENNQEIREINGQCDSQDEKLRLSNSLFSLLATGRSQI